MRGTIKSRLISGNSLRYDVIFDIPRGPNGKRRQVTKTYRTKREAERALNDALQQVQTGQYVDGQQSTAEYLNDWIQSKVALRPTTLRSYRQHVATYLIPYLGHLRLDQLRPIHVQRMYSDIKQARMTDNALSASTMKRIHATLLSALESAVMQRLLTYNPAKYVELEPARTPPQKHWDAVQVRIFLESIKDDPLMPLFQLTAYRGLRRGEAVGLRWQYVNFTANTIDVREQLVTVGHDVVTGPPKSSSSQRTVTLDNTTSEILRRHRILQSEMKLRMGTAWPTEDYVFTKPDGQPYHPNYVYNRFRALTLEAGLPLIRFHDLRHTSASLGLASGESLKEISVRLGHREIGITANIYAHVSHEMSQDSADRLAKFIDGSSATGS